MSNLAEHEAEQAALTALCEAGECNHPECQEPQKITLICPHCDSDNITRETTAYWDIDAQAWEMSDSLGVETCQECCCEITPTRISI